MEVYRNLYSPYNMSMFSNIQVMGIKEIINQDIVLRLKLLRCEIFRYLRQKIDGMWHKAQEQRTTVGFLFFEPPRETKIGLKNREIHEFGWKITVFLWREEGDYVWFELPRGWKNQEFKKTFLVGILKGCQRSCRVVKSKLFVELTLMPLCFIPGAVSP